MYFRTCQSISRQPHLYCDHYSVYVLRCVHTGQDENYRRLQLSRHMSWENAIQWLSNMICLDFKRHMILLQTFTFQLSTVNIPNLETHSYWAGISLQTLNPWLNSSELNSTYETGLSEVLTYCKFVSFAFIVDKFSIVCNVCTNFVTFSREK